MICSNCGTEFEAKRGDAKYCSGKCRKAAARIPAVGILGKPIEEPESVTIEPEPTEGSETWLKGLNELEKQLWLCLADPDTKTFPMNWTRERTRSYFDNRGIPFDQRPAYLEALAKQRARTAKPR